MGFVHNNEFRCLFHKDISSFIRLNKIYADDLIRVIVVYPGVAVYLPIELGLCIGPDNHGFNIQFCPNLFLPLFAKMRETDDCETFDLTSLKHLPHDEQRFYGFPHSHVICNQQSYWILLKSHDQRHNLIGSRAKGEFGQTSERTCTVAKGESCSVVQDSG